MKLLRVKEAADLLGVHQQTIYKALRRGTLRAIRLADKGSYLIPEAELTKWAVRPSR